MSEEIDGPEYIPSKSYLDEIAKKVGCGLKFDYDKQSHGFVVSATCGFMNRNKVDPRSLEIIFRNAFDELNIAQQSEEGEHYLERRGEGLWVSSSAIRRAESRDGKIEVCRYLSSQYADPAKHFPSQFTEPAGSTFPEALVAGLSRESTLRR